MKRKHLIRDIQQLDQRLTTHQIRYHQHRQASLLALKRTPILYLVGAGFLTGAVVGRLGWHSSYAMGRMGAHLYPLLQRASGI